MDRCCAVCGQKMQDGYYLKDEACLFSSVTLNRKISALRRESADLHALVCPGCGHVEFYVELEDEQMDQEGAG